MWYKCIFYRLFLKACCLLQFLRQALFGDKLSERFIVNLGMRKYYYTKFHKEGAKNTKNFDTILYLEDLVFKGQYFCNPG